MDSLVRLFRFCVYPTPSLPRFSLSRVYTFLARYNTLVQGESVPGYRLAAVLPRVHIDTHGREATSRLLFTHVRRVHTCRNRRAPQSGSRTVSFDVSFCVLLLLLILRPNAISNFDIISSGVSSTIEFARSCASRFVNYYRGKMFKYITVYNLVICKLFVSFFEADLMILFKN